MKNKVVKECMVIFLVLMGAEGILSLLGFNYFVGMKSVICIFGVTCIYFDIRMQKSVKENSETKEFLYNVMSLIISLTAIRYFAVNEGFSVFDKSGDVSLCILTFLLIVYLWRNTVVKLVKQLLMAKRNHISKEKNENISC